MLLEESDVKGGNRRNGLQDERNDFVLRHTITPSQKNSRGNRQPSGSSITAIISNATGCIKLTFDFMLT